MTEPCTLAVLVSGNGSNLQAVIDAVASGLLDAKIEVVVSNKPAAYALERAALSGIPTEVLEASETDRSVYDAKLAELVASYDPDLVVLAGWNRLLTQTFLSSQIVINLHPALPETFAGLGCIEKSYDAFQTGEVAEVGIMVHYVPDEGVDDGPVVASQIVPLSTSDSLQDYAARVHEAEHQLIVKAIETVGSELLG